MRSTNLASKLHKFRSDYMKFSKSLKIYKIFSPA